MGEVNNTEDMYIYNLPYDARRELCMILDQNDQWDVLGGRYMNFGRGDLERFRRARYCERSPTDLMIQEWGQQNNTVKELFLFLYEMGHYQAMTAIKSCVPVRYHSLFNLKAKLNHAATTKRRQLLERDRAQQSPRGEMEGATSLPTPNQKYGSENLNKVSSSPRERIVSKKIPENLLCPSPVPASESLKPKSFPPNYERMNGQLATVPDSKMVSNQPYGGPVEMSCEDNNQQTVKSSGISGASYSPSEDYRRMAEKKRAEIEGEAAGRATVNQHMPTANGAKPKVNGMCGHPPENFAGESVPRDQHRDALNNYHHHHHNQSSIEYRQQLSKTSATSDASRQNDCMLPQVHYKELEEATSCWNKDNILGRGGFGEVYKGKWKCNDVAIKRLRLSESADESAQLQIEEALDELRLCVSHQHDNILQAYGFSADPGQPPCLVYQFMPNGSVEDRLLLRRHEGFSLSNNWAPLTWEQRLCIAHGTAKALQFLHTVNQKPLIHGDVKSANILLDKYLLPKLGDFGLAREGKSQSTSLKVTRVCGTRAYLPYDFLRSKRLSVKVDTYSFGIVLFELCTGLRALDEKRKGDTKYLSNLVAETPATEEERLRDPNIGKEQDAFNIFHTLLDIAKSCVPSAPSRRPKMETVFSELDKYQSFCSVPPSTPFFIQLQHDLAAGKSGLTPGRPNTQSSNPSTVPPSSHASTFMQPTSIPPVAPNPCNPPLHANQILDPYRHCHPNPRLNGIPGKQSNGNVYQYPVCNTAFDGRVAVRPVIPNVEPPPSYNEAVSPTSCGPIGGNNIPLNPMIPDLSALNINPDSHNLAHHPNAGKGNSPNIPLLSVIGLSTSKCNKSEPSQPSAANKKSIVDDSSDDEE